MEMWTIVKMTITHCIGAVLVCAAFAGAACLIELMFPNDTIRWWLQKVDFVLAVTVPTVLGLIFLNSLLRIVLEALIGAWKGFPNGKAQLLLA
jgi:hypothetical protein